MGRRSKKQSKFKWPPWPSAGQRQVCDQSKRPRRRIAGDWLASGIDHNNQRAEAALRINCAMKDSKTTSSQRALIVCAALMSAVLAIAAATRLAHASEQPVERPASKEKPFASMINFALINGRANLVCDIQAPTADDSVALILWYKDDSLAPIYTVDARKVNSLDRAKISLDEHYSSRLGFNLKTKPAQLELEPLQQEDEGEYRCRVDFKRGRTVNTIISLRIIIPPQDLSIFMVRDVEGTRSAGPEDRTSGSHSMVVTNEQQQQQQHYNNRSLVRLPAGGLIGPFNEDSELELVCMAQGGKPRPQVTWRRDFNVLNSTEFIQLDKGGTGVALRLAALNKQHLLSVFTCQATNNNLTSALQSSITLDLNLKPQEVVVRQLNSHEPLQVGQTTTFECVTSGSRPQATIHWLFQGQRHDSPMSVDQQQTSSKLSLVLQRSFNQQPLTCVAENPRISPWATAFSPTGHHAKQAASKQTSVKLDVHYPPQLSVALDTRQAASRQTVPGASSAPEAVQPEVRQDHEQNDPTTGEQHHEVGNLASKNLLQEGNDIYLFCHMDANPRPLKPIVWRFNGRPLVSTSPTASAAGLFGDSSRGEQQTQQQAIVVISGQSLVLRKVSRHQSGAYTCEATNQHGTNTSKPFQLTIKHAPVCQTDDILVYEASPNQLVNIDCQVLANPAKSVHFSWFAAYGAQQNVSDWINREASLDEQLDTSSSQLKFRVKPESGFAFIKCKAKNEIGLQQRVCLFQVVPARAPSLRHSCTLANANAQSLRVECNQNEHLKTNEYQLTKVTSPGPGAGPNAGKSVVGDDPLAWMRNYEAVRASLSEGQSLGARDLVSATPPRRLVYPPEWLLVELYRKLSSGSKSDQRPRTTDQSNSNTSHDDYELQSYIVVSESSQLTHVKSLLEDNKWVFQAQPRDVYYVRTLHDNSSVSSGAAAAAMAASEEKKQPVGGDTTSGGGHAHHSVELTTPGDLRLARSFQFQVPNLEPETRYKLLVYGQNLANKTHDWQVVRSETLPGHQQTANGNAETSGAGKTGLQVRDQHRQQPSGEQSADSLLAQSSKSLVMRSEQITSGDTSEATVGQPFEWTSGQSDSHEPRQQVAGLSTSKVIAQLHGFKDQALSYARQRPLLSIPIGLLGCLALAFFLIYLSGLFVELLRGRGRTESLSGSGSSSSAVDKPPSESSNFSSADSNTSHSSHQQQQQRQQQRHQRPPNASDDELDQRKRAKLAADGLTSTAGTCFSPQPGQLDGDSAYQNQAQLASLRGQHDHLASYTLDTLDALALRDPNQESRHQHQVALAGSLAWPDHGLGQPGLECSLHQQQQHHHVGSLDRRGMATLYLASDRGIANLDQFMDLHLGQQHQQPDQQRARHGHHLGGSIDRRAGHAFASSLASAATSQYQPLFMGANGGGGGGGGGTLQTPVPRTRRAKSSLQAQHRVAFDLSNQQQQQQQAGFEANDPHQMGATHLMGRDSSSGSNNSTAATNTADSGHESPGTTGGETGSCQSGLHMHQSQRLHQYHQQSILLAGACSEHPTLSSSPGCSCAVHPQRIYASNNGNSFQMQLIEFPSPSSQESSTLLHSIDSSFDAGLQRAHYAHCVHAATPAAAAAAVAMANGQNGDNCNELDANNNQNQKYLIHPNHHRMATSFTSRNQANDGNQAQLEDVPMAPLEPNSESANHWL